MRRYVADAGPLLPRLHKLVRADCTTRNKRRAARLQANYDELEARIDELAPRLDAIVERLERTVERVERIVGLGEAVMSPLAVTESAVRGMVNAVRRSGR